ncbi:hypothetical protein MHU86_15118 [Fragilaria crotonensis]|nr:hypothetical protein MHU86_15118 [Fragilaria crotonensis]
MSPPSRPRNTQGIRGNPIKDLGLTIQLAFRHDLFFGFSRCREGYLRRGRLLSQQLSTDQKPPGIIISVGASEFSSVLRCVIQVPEDVNQGKLIFTKLFRHLLVCPLIPIFSSIDSNNSAISSLRSARSSGVRAQNVLLTIGFADFGNRNAASRHHNLLLALTSMPTSARCHCRGKK